MLCRTCTMRTLLLTPSRVHDVCSASFPSRAAAPPRGAYAETLFTYVGGNFGDSAGGAAIFGGNGSVAWTTTAAAVSAVSLPVAQGWEWVLQLSSTS